AEDLQRFRAGRPITARPVGPAERTWRWCRRNPLWAAMIALVTLLLSGVTGVSLYAYATMAGMDNAILREQEKDKVTRVLAEQLQQEEQEARTRAEQNNKELLQEQQKERKARALAEKRLNQSMAAVELFVTDARVFCEDAMVPAQSRKQLNEVLLTQLEKQV